MAVILDENFDKIKKAWENGVVTITPGFNEQIKDYNPNTESGNAFVFKNANEWEIFAAIVRAVETYKFPYDWKFIVRSCKASI
jgi:glycogen synthase